MGAMFFAVLAVAGQIERNYIREKTLEGQVIAASKGNHGALAPTAVPLFPEAVVLQVRGPLQRDSRSGRSDQKCDLPSIYHRDSGRLVLPPEHEHRTQMGCQHQRPSGDQPARRQAHRDGFR
jgi:hypothetical protein